MSSAPSGWKVSTIHCGAPSYSWQSKQPTEWCSMHGMAASSCRPKIPRATFPLGGTGKLLQSPYRPLWKFASRGGHELVSQSVCRIVVPSCSRASISSMP